VTIQAIVWWGWWAVPFLAGFLIVFVRRMAQNFTAEKARRAAELQARIAQIEHELGINSTPDA
jgi:hypothetical protein